MYASEAVRGLRQPLTAEALIRSQIISCEFCREKCGTGTDFSSNAFLCKYHSINAPYLLRLITSLLRRTGRRILGMLKQNSIL
jgi:hypothetical protein